jgi:two-component system response regulator DesR
MPGRNGIDVAAELTSSGSSCRALIVTTFGRPGYLRRAMAAGARGFVVKDTPAEQLAKTIREVAAGRRVVDPVLAAESMGVGESPLSPREAEVLAAAADGASVREVAARVHLSVGTVRNHLSAAIGKTGAGNRAEAARIARDRGWLLDT